MKLRKTYGFMQQVVRALFPPADVTHKTDKPNLKKCSNHFKPSNLPRVINLNAKGKLIQHTASAARANKRLAVKGMGIRQYKRRVNASKGLML